MSTLKVDGIRSNSASSDAITLASDGTCTANITNRSNRNLLHNGSFIIHQRGGTATAQGFLLDRWYAGHGGGTTTISQGTETSGTVYEKGLVNYYRITNTANSTTSTTYRYLTQRIEAQDLLKSGWNYKSASSKITLSFWVRSSVAQNFYGYLRFSDSPGGKYVFETGSLSADTWTKVTKVVPGYTSANIDNDNGAGMEVLIAPYWGTDMTASGVALNTWAAWDGGERAPDYATTWVGTNGTTFDVTGVQLEVGDHATDFEHRSYGQELALCQRYFQVLGGSNGTYDSMATGSCASSTVAYVPHRLITTMRSTPSFTLSGAASDFRYTKGSDHEAIALALDQAGANMVAIRVTTSSTSADAATRLFNINTTGAFQFSAEL